MRADPAVRSTPLPGAMTLLARAQAGDEDAFAALTAPFARSLWGLLYRWTRRQEDADELAQDVWLKAWLALVTGQESFGHAVALERWCFTVAVNLARDHHRRQMTSSGRLHGDPGGRRRFVGWDVLSERDQLRRHEATQVPDVAIATLLARDGAVALAAAVRAVLDELPGGAGGRNAAAFRLRAIDGLDYHQIAAATGLTTSAVKSSLCRTRGVLRRHPAVQQAWQALQTGGGS